MPETVVASMLTNGTPQITTPVPIARSTNRTVAGLIVALMLGMAALGLAFALRTQAFRRANDSKGVQEPEPAADSRPVPPAEWPGLGYLPDDGQAMAGVRVADALESPAARVLLGALGISNTNQTRWLGAAPGEVEHLLFGASLRALPPRVTGVLHTRSPVTDRQLRAAVASERTIEQHEKTLLRGKLWANGPDGVVWRPDRFLLVAALLPEDFDRVPSRSMTGAARFVSPLPELLADRVDPEALAWLVAAVDDKSPALGLAASMLPLPPADREALGKLEALAVSVRADGTKLTLALHVRGRDAPAEAITKALAESLTKSGVTAERRADGDWQRLTATADAEKLAEWLSGLRAR